MQRVNMIDNFRDFVNEIFNEALNKKASDVHIEPQKDAVLIRFRVDWEMYSIFEIANSNKDNLLTRIKIMSQLKIDENRLPQDWNIVYQFDDDEEVDMRVSTFPTLYWEKICIRLLRKDSSLLNIDSLWFLQINLKYIKKALEMKEWLVLVSWPTWSWKTTTLYAMLNYFDPEKHNISTLEDPVEYKLKWVNQSAVRTDIWYTFSSGLRTLLRQDPDIVLVWEIRDRETAKLAVEASLTWHLVFWTIHSNRWAWVVERLINMWIEPYLVASALKLIVSQRLVKKLCDCNVPVQYNENELKYYEEWLWSIWESVKWEANFRTTKWCEKCMNIWYTWRAWLHEITIIDRDFSKLIVNGLDHRAWNMLMQEKWYLSVYQDWLLKSAFWNTDLKQILPYKE